jgi:hypothetical protein
MSASDVEADCHHDDQGLASACGDVRNDSERVRREACRIHRLRAGHAAEKMMGARAISASVGWALSTGNSR